MFSQAFIFLLLSVQRPKAKGKRTKTVVKVREVVVHKTYSCKCRLENVEEEKDLHIKKRITVGVI